MNKSGTDNKRLVHLDVLRIIAIYMVLFNHTGTKGFVLFTVSRESAFFPFYLCNAIFIKIAVPLFFMVSGALLLRKEESLCKVTGRFVRFLIILIVASAIAYFYKYFRLQAVDHISLVDFFTLLYKEPLSDGLWFLYAYLGYLLVLPFLRAIAQNMEKKMFIWLLAVTGLFSFLQIVEWILWRGAVFRYSYFTAFITSFYVLYPLMGYYIENRMPESRYNRKTLAVLLLASCIAIIVCAYMTCWRCSSIGEWEEESCQTFFSTFIYIPAGTVYYVTKYFFITHDLRNRTKRIISIIGNATFGLYLIEQICRRETVFIYSCLKPYIHSLPACWVWILAACMMGIIITIIIKKAPFIGKYI